MGSIRWSAIALAAQSLVFLFGGGVGAPNKDIGAAGCRGSVASIPDALLDEIFAAGPGSYPGENDTERRVDVWVLVEGEPGLPGPV